MYRRWRGCPRGVSLLELLVVVGIIMLLIGMLVPYGLRRVRTQSQLLVCSSRLRQWGIALQLYEADHDGLLPTEGTFLAGGITKPGTWYNELPPYLGAPSYKDVEGANDRIKEFPQLDVWICPAKNMSANFKSRSGKNQIHFGMNQVLDGMGKPPKGGSLTPGFPDYGDIPIRSTRFINQPNTVFMFDIAPNSPAGHPKQVATKFHRGFANVLYLDGRVSRFRPADFVYQEGPNKGDIVWRHTELYWGYLPPREPAPLP